MINKPVYRNDDPSDYEDELMQTCVECAIAAGHTGIEAYDCDNGSVNCPECPFRSKKDESANSVS